MNQPESVPDPEKFRSVYDLLRAGAGRHPDRIFIHAIDQDAAITWGELYALSNRLAHFFRDRGIRANDRIAVLSHNTLESLILYFAIQRYGAAFCTVNVEVNADHVREMLNRLNPKLVLWHQELDVGEFGDGSPGEWIPFDHGDADHGLFTLASMYPETPELPTVAGPDDVCVISFTSGTSAAPKGVIHNYGNYYWIGEQSVSAWGLTERDRMLEFRSISWASSHMLCLQPCLMAGATILVARRFSRRNFFRWVAEHQASVVIGVPTVINMLLERKQDVDRDALASLRFMTSSTAPLMVEQHRRFEDTYGIRLVQIYGMSEGGVLAANHHDDRRIGSVGRPGLYQNLRILGPEGETLPAGETGEIEIGGAQNGFGYLHPDGRLERIRGRRLKTGDIGYIDGDGFLYITGRAKDVIIRGGVNIAPLEIDNVLAAHPDILEAATIGVPDPVYGEEVVSYLVARDGAPVSEAALRDYCNRKLADFKRPRHLTFVDALPRNARGKIDRSALAETWTGEAVSR